MSNVFVGLQSNPRAHSRILKPPGGASSIMLDDELLPSVDPDRMKKRNQEKWAKELLSAQNNSQNHSQNEDRTDKINNSNLEISTKCTSEDNNESIETTGSNTQTSTSSTTVETSVSSSGIQETNIIMEKQSNQRVPPGGHSKGLW